MAGMGIILNDINQTKTDTEWFHSWKNKKEKTTKGTDETSTLEILLQYCGY